MEDFGFVQPYRRVDWRLVQQVDLRRAEEAKSAAQAQKVLRKTLGSVLYGSLENEEDIENLAEDENVIKAFRLGQYTAQYLSHCQDALARKTQAVQQNMDYGLAHLEEMHERFTARKLQKRRLRKELSKLDDLISQYDTTLKVLRPDLARRLVVKEDGSVAIRVSSKAIAADAAAAAMAGSGSSSSPSTSDPKDRLSPAAEFERERELAQSWRMMKDMEARLSAFRKEAEDASSLRERLAIAEAELARLRKESQRQSAPQHRPNEPGQQPPTSDFADDLSFDERRADNRAFADQGGHVKTENSHANFDDDFETNQAFAGQGGHGKKKYPHTSFDDDSDMVRISLDEESLHSVLQKKEVRVKPSRIPFQGDVHSRVQGDVNHRDELHLCDDMESEMSLIYDSLDPPPQAGEKQEGPHSDLAAPVRARDWHEEDEDADGLDNSMYASVQVDESEQAKDRVAQENAVNEAEEEEQSILEDELVTQQVSEMEDVGALRASLDSFQETDSLEEKSAQERFSGVASKEEKDDADPLESPQRPFQESKTEDIGSEEEADDDVDNEIDSLDGDKDSDAYEGKTRDDSQMENVQRQQGGPRARNLSEDEEEDESHASGNEDAGSMSNDGGAVSKSESDTEEDSRSKIESEAEEEEEEDARSTTIGRVNDEIDEDEEDDYASKNGSEASEEEEEEEEEESARQHKNETQAQAKAKWDLEAFIEMYPEAAEAARRRPSEMTVPELKVDEDTLEGSDTLEQGSFPGGKPSHASSADEGTQLSPTTTLDAASPLAENSLELSVSASGSPHEAGHGRGSRANSEESGSQFHQSIDDAESPRARSGDEASEDDASDDEEESQVRKMDGASENDVASASESESDDEAVRHPLRSMLSPRSALTMSSEEPTRGAQLLLSSGDGFGEVSGDAYGRAESDLESDVSGSKNFRGGVSGEVEIVGGESDADGLVSTGRPSLVSAGSSLMLSPGETFGTEDVGEAMGLSSKNRASPSSASSALPSPSSLLKDGRFDAEHDLMEGEEDDHHHVGVEDEEDVEEEWFFGLPRRAQADSAVVVTLESMNVKEALSKAVSTAPGPRTQLHLDVQFLDSGPIASLPPRAGAGLEYAPTIHLDETVTFMLGVASSSAPRKLHFRLALADAGRNVDDGGDTGADVDAEAPLALGSLVLPAVSAGGLVVNLVGVAAATPLATLRLRVRVPAS